MIETHHSDIYPQTILRDTREQRPWAFSDATVATQDVTLSTGDYAVPAHCTHSPKLDTYHPQFAVERKSGHDFLTALTWERDRFTAELQRSDDWSHPLAVVIETSWETLLRNQGCMANRDIHPNHIVGTVSAWVRYYNVEFYFTETRQHAQRCAFLLFIRHSLLQRYEQRQ